MTRFVSKLSSNLTGSRAEWLGSLALTAALPVVLMLAFGRQLPDLPVSALTLGFALAGCFAAILLTPGNPVRVAGRLLRPTLWAPVAAGILWLSCSALAVMQGGPAAAPPAGLGIAMLLVLLLFVGLQLVLRNRLGEPSAAAVAVLSLLLLSAVPVLLSPLAARCSESQWLVNLAVNLSPLSYFASALAFDYLRYNFFYDHLSLGSLRFAYLSPLISGSIIATAALLVHLAGRSALAVSAGAAGCSDQPTARGAEHPTITLRTPDS